MRMATILECILMLQIQNLECMSNFHTCWHDSMRQAQVDHQQHLWACQWRWWWKHGFHLLQGKKSVFCKPRDASRLFSVLSVPLKYLDSIVNLMSSALCNGCTFLKPLFRFSFGAGEWRDGSASWWSNYQLGCLGFILQHFPNKSY